MGVQSIQSFVTSTLFSFFCVQVLFITESHAQLGNSTVINISPTLANTAAAPTVDRSFIGYSLEHNAMPSFLNSQILNNLMNLWTSKTGGRPGIRIGGSGMDKTTYVPDFDEPVIWTTNPSSMYLVGPSYFTLIKDYFPSDTQITFGLNLVNSTGNWSNTVDFAVAADMNLPQADLFEIGNEPDLYVQGKQRPSGWVGKDYAAEWITVANKVKEALPSARFQPAVFAGSLEDGFDLSSLVKAGINTGSFNIPTYSIHFYPQSACSGNQNLNNLIDHNTLGGQLQKFNPEIAAAEAGGARFTLAESNTVSCSGFVDVSDTYASALWLVDYTLAAATRNIDRIYFHNGPTTPYTLFIPKGASGLTAGIRPMSFGVYFLAEALALPAQGSTTKFLVTPVSLPDSPPDIAVYGLYSNKVQKPNLDVIGTTARAYTTGVPSTRTIYITNKPETLTSVSTKMIIKSVSTSTKRSTSTRIVTVTKTTRVPKRTMVRATRTTTTKNRLGNGKTTTRTTKIVYWKTTTTTVPSVTRSRSTSRRTITSLSLSTLWTSQKVTITKVISRTKPLIATTYSVSTAPKVLSSTDTSATIKPQATDIGNFPLNDGVFLARAVVLNLSRYNTSDTSVLNCRSCNGPSPEGFGTLGERNSTTVSLTGFQPNHRLKLLRLTGPGLNAKSGINVSGLAFDEDTGAVTSAPQPGNISVDKTGKVVFDILASEAVLLVDENVV
ncbi:uncharacterized protein DFL_001615 [Arthrobotrys flagrans]|uniref:Beta-glucuronidase C-terminal domain-containing protein n=1 Tax=Arthrobotrys flagrans TaxID=97331 RepID=A0A437A845_ARTFL|nr:hypothetical protein DFL_001615 [Arthrobotrys flagrans]